MRFVTWTQADGVIALAEINDAMAAVMNVTDEMILASFDRPGRVPEGSTRPRIVDVEGVPADRTFRSAWMLDGDRAVAVDMEKARGLHLARLRTDRNVALQETDGPFMRALEADDKPTLARLKAERQALRDLPADIAGELDAAATPEDLLAVRPAVLENRR